MDFSLAGTMQLSMEEKRKFVRELAKNPHGSPETLLSWSRQEILQLLCLEMGKERKYTGLTKLKIIENLLKIVSEKDSRECGARGSEQPVQMIIQCENSACKAILSPEDAFCKRCSCCICRKFDDNKDPSLWLTCNSDPPFESESCNMSCHLECALRHERSGLSKRGQVAQLDGSFYCVSCGKMNDLLKCWRKQLTIARDTRRVDILCYRVFLSQKLLNETNKYQKLSEIVDEAVSKLQAEVGPLTDITVKMGRGIVNRMSTGHEIQRLCASAVELLDSILSEATVDSLTPVNEDSSGLNENNKTDNNNNNVEDGSPVTNCSTLSNPSSVEDETNNITSGLNDNNKTDKNVASLECVVGEENRSNKPTTTDIEIIPESSKKETGNDEEDRSKKRKRESQEEDLELYVKVIRRLECEGHIEKSFRKKFLTWYSLRATPREMLVVQVFVNTFREDPAALAEQLIDAFDEVVSSKRFEPKIGPGFCMKLWH